MRFVAATTTTLPLDSKPSINVSSCATRRLPTPFVSVSREEAIESISSKKMIARLSDCAAAKIMRSVSSLSPTYLLTIVGPETR